MKNFDIKNVVRPHILSIKPYSSARDEYKGTSGVFLDANENPLGSVGGQKYNRYPDPLQWNLKLKIQAVKGVKPAQIFLGNGSDEPIDLLFRAFCEPREDAIIQMPPTYGMYQVCSDINEIKVINVPLTSDYHIQKEKVLEAFSSNVKIVFICNPNNPTGNNLNRSDILEIIEKFDGLVVIDEAYIDFSTSDSFVSGLDKYPNLVVLQTFSKAWGLAGVRLGMAFASETIITILNKIKYPYNINILTQVAVSNALDKAEEMKEMVNLICAERDLLMQKLRTMPFVQRLYSSDTNFIMVKFDKAASLFQYMIAHEVIVRDRTKILLCEDNLRISIGTKEENSILFDTICAFYK